MTKISLKVTIMGYDYWEELSKLKIKDEIKVRACISGIAPSCAKKVKGSRAERICAQCRHAIHIKLNPGLTSSYTGVRK